MADDGSGTSSGTDAAIAGAIAAATPSPHPSPTRSSSRSSSRPSSRDEPTVSAADRHVTHHIHHRNALPTTITTVSTMSLSMDDYNAEYRMAYKKLSSDGITDSEPSHIIGNIYVGSLLAASNIKYLYNNLHITHILSIGSVPLVSGPFSYYHVDADDRIKHTIKPHFIQTNIFLKHCISKTSNNTLIHCYAGKSRSITILLAFLSYLYLHNPHNLHPLLLPIRSFIQPDDEPLWIGHMLTYIQDKRSKAFPNRGFYSQLMNYEDELVAKHCQKCKLEFCFIRDRRPNDEDNNNKNNNDNNSNDQDNSEKKLVERQVRLNEEQLRVSPSSASSSTSSSSPSSSSSST